MHRRLLVCAIVLHVAAAHASERLQYEARIVLLRTDEDRTAWCGSHQRIEACTRFVAVQLAARAVEHEGVWHVATNATFIAYIGLKDRSRYGHEMIHVRDVESAIESYLADLERQSFASRKACEQVRVDAIDQFDGRVRSFVEASNLRRDGDPHPER